MILWIYLLLWICILFYFLIYLMQNPTEGLHLYNLLIDYFHEEKIFYNDEEKVEIFPKSIILEEKWKQIKEEALDIIEEVKGNVGKIFINQDEDFWKDWNTFELRLFGVDNEINMAKCPILSEILKSDINITTAFFSIIGPHKTIHSHYGPFKGILRYHLGLEIPEGNCLISVGNEIYKWKNGEGILFDETHKHFVLNETDYPRVILFLDVKRPMHSSFMKLINDSLISIMGRYKSIN